MANVQVTFDRIEVGVRTINALYRRQVTVPGSSSGIRRAAAVQAAAEARTRVSLIARGRKRLARPTASGLRGR
jgi:short-subunit dehydrogenase